MMTNPGMQLTAAQIEALRCWCLLGSPIEPLSSIGLFRAYFSALRRGQRCSVQPYKNAAAITQTQQKLNRNSSSLKPRMLRKISPSLEPDSIDTMNSLKVQVQVRKGGNVTRFD